jgi:hypothetical protein
VDVSSSYVEVFTSTCLGCLLPSLIMVNRSEKVDILPATVAMAERRPRTSRWRILGVISVFAVVMTLRCTNYGASISGIQLGRQDADPCPQSNVVYPVRHAQLWENLGNEYDQNAFKERVVEWLGGAVRIPYVVTALAVLSFSEARILNKARKPTTGWAPSASMSGGRFSGSSMTILLRHFHLCM